MCVAVPWCIRNGPLLLRPLLFGYCGRNLTSRAPAQTLYSKLAHIIVFCGQCKSKLELGSLRQSLLHFLADGRSALVIKMHIYWRWRHSHRAKCLECRRLSLFRSQPPGSGSPFQAITISFLSPEMRAKPPRCSLKLYYFAVASLRIHFQFSSRERVGVTIDAYFLQVKNEIRK